MFPISGVCWTIDHQLISINHWQKSRKKAQRKETHSLKTKKNVVVKWIGDRLDDQIEEHFFVLSSPKIRLVVIFKTNHLKQNGEESVVDPHDFFIEGKGVEMELEKRWRWNNGREREDHIMEWKEYFWVTSNKFSSERSIIGREWSSTLRWSLFWSCYKNDDGWRIVDLSKLLDMIERIRHNSSTLFDFSVIQWQRFQPTKTKCVTNSLLLNRSVRHRIVVGLEDHPRLPLIGNKLRWKTSL